MENNQTNRKKPGIQVFAFPARTLAFDGKQVFYLFSLRQVVEVMKHADSQPVPFGPKSAEGISEWRGRVLPVLSLENCLGIQKSDRRQPFRTIVVRSVSKSSAGHLQELYAIIKVGAAVYQLELPLACDPVDVPDWITDASCLSGVYQNQERFLIVVNMEKILNA